MSDAETKPEIKPETKPEAKPLFTAKEEALLKIAWLCLKSPPEIDYQKLQELGQFNTMKTCTNTWGTIKKKLMQNAPPASADDPATPTKGGDETGKSAKSPKAKTLKKRGRKDDEAEDDAAVDQPSPKKRRKVAQD
ncbi:hypothetical protein LTR66_005583 [Elasticomyces elasticus]|nr:hypothetical protein LTR50_000009 [Elasticomyces elasticus]KAK4994374.1 hypothetical protein LTR66_005583 [Elasticomyces elasticus]